jgi:hypothetical protein
VILGGRSNPRLALETLHLSQLNADKLPGEPQATKLPAMDSSANGQGVDIPARGELLDGEL